MVGKTWQWALEADSHAVSTTRKQRKWILMLSWLFIFALSRRHQPRGLCHPYLGWDMLCQLTQCKSSLTDILRDLPTRWSCIMSRFKSLTVIKCKGKTHSVYSIGFSIPKGADIFWHLVKHLLWMTKSSCLIQKHKINSHQYSIQLKLHEVLKKFKVKTNKFRRNIYANMFTEWKLRNSYSRYERYKI